MDMMLYAAVVFLPLCGFIIAGTAALFNVQTVFFRWLTCALVGTAAVLAWKAFLFDAGRAAEVFPLATWWEAGSLRVDWALRIDSLSRMMAAVITGVSALVHVYSLGYMKEEATPSRFFAYLSLFTFTMLMLVTADNFGQLFFGWEGVGLASYLLIGYWYHKPSACAASVKAFVVNRVADAALIIGTALVYHTFGTLDFAPLLNPEKALEAVTTVPFLGYEVQTLSLIGLLLFIGAMGKSAQLFLHTWLPDAMEGPTPVSALIHAATMVTAGVFLCARLSPLYALLPEVSYFILIIGTLTMLFAALVAPAQTDIKRIVAYSTCSQLGYMFMAIGAGAYGAAVFHLFTHAFFKALLFLSAGAVIHSLHHEQEIYKMGGLRRTLPATFALTLIGTAAITGLGIPGLFGFAGFYSKDAVIEAVAAAPGGTVPALFGVFGALLTACYSWRSVWRVFFGKFRGDHHTYEHAHESPWTMQLPMWLLAVASLLSGFVFADRFIGAGAESFWAGALVLPAEHAEHGGHFAFWVIAPLAVSVLGLLFSAWLLLYVRGGAGPVQGFALLRHKFYFDEIYNFLLVRPYAAFARKSAEFDRDVPDALLAKMLPCGLSAWAGKVSAWHNGAADLYCYFIALGAGALIFSAVVL